MADHLLIPSNKKGKQRMLITKIFRNFFEHLDLYSIDLSRIELYIEKKCPEYIFKILSDLSELNKLQLHIDERGKKYEKIIAERFKSKDYLCFCFIDKSSGQAACTRWLLKKTFYHDLFKDTIHLAENEAFTLDSYTSYTYRGRGLHKELNKRMLNYCFEDLRIKNIFMVIHRGSQYAHLIKIVKDLGYKRIRSRFYLKKWKIRYISHGWNK